MKGVKMKRKFLKSLSLALGVLVMTTSFVGCGKKEDMVTINFLNWGENIAEGLIDEFESKYYFDGAAGSFQYQSSKDPTVAYNNVKVVAVWDTEDPIFFPGKEQIATTVKTTIEIMKKDIVHNDDGSKQEFHTIWQPVYIPANMPEDQRNKLEQDMLAAKAEMEAYAKEQGLGDITVVFELKVDSGTYDYNSKEEDYTYIGGPRHE